ncbi:Tic22 family protein [Baaleninema sp.]|uniref:Tic22 family protein n=1 Tax=Baaleninema sp. TaxID=3101197 RepID=UPI003D00A7AC
MKSIVRWLAALGLMGGTLLGSLVPAMPAAALSEEEVLEKLATIPVFTITNNDGAFFLDAVPNAQNQSQPQQFVRVFFDIDDAKQAAEDIATQRPDLEDDLRVTLTSMADIYMMEQEFESEGANGETANGEDSESLEFAYIPPREEMNAAVSLLQEQDRTSDLLEVEGQNGETVYIFPGVPLFAATVGTGENQRYLSVQQNGEAYVPLFFDRDDLNNAIQQANLSEPVDTQVLQLESLLDRMTVEDANDAAYEQLVLIPTRESARLMENVIQEMQQRSGEGTPVDPPAATPEN